MTLLKNISLIVLLLLSYGQAFSQQETKITHLLNGVNVKDIDSDGKYIWFATNGDGIIKLNLKNGRWDSYSTDNNKLQNDFFHSIAVNSKYVYAGSADGLFILNQKRNKWLKRKFAKGGQLSNWIRSIKYDKKERAVWIGRFKYLTKFDESRRRFSDFDLTRKGNEKTNTIKTIELDGDSLVWFGTEGGLQRYDKRYSLQDESAITFFDNSYNYFMGLGEMVSVSDILFEQNYIWLGTDELITAENPDFNPGGLFRFDRKNEWKKFSTADGLPGNGIYSIENVGKYIWVATYQFDNKLRERYGRGLAVIDKISLSVKPVLDERIPQTINKIFFDGKSVWLGTNDGVVKIEINNDLDFILN